MTKQEVITQVLKELHNELKVNGYEVCVKTVKHEDEIIRESIVIERYNNMDACISIDDIYQEYLNGVSIRQIALFIHDHVDQSMSHILSRINQIVDDFSIAQYYVVARIVNRVKNKTLLEENPHFDIHDLSIVYYIEMPFNGGTISKQVSDEMVEDWIIDAETLHTSAMNNTMLLHPVDVIPMISIIEELLSREEFEQDVLEGFVHEVQSNLIVITNAQKMYGAIHMLNTDALIEVSMLLQSEELAILPSSIHEVIVCPKDMLSCKELQSMVFDVNRNEVLPKDVLSDNVYLFNRNTKEITLWK